MLGSWFVDFSISFHLKKTRDEREGGFRRIFLVRCEMWWELVKWWKLDGVGHGMRDRKCIATLGGVCRAHGFEIFTGTFGNPVNFRAISQSCESFSPRGEGQAYH